MVTQGNYYTTTTNGNLIPVGAYTYYGLSTDSKPTAGVGNGASFIEMDTGKVYFYDASEGGSGWIEWGASS